MGILIKNNEIEAKIEMLKTEATDLLEDNGLEWQDEFLNPKDFSPEWDFEMEDDSRWFNIILGKMIMLYDLMMIDV